MEDWYKYVQLAAFIHNTSYLFAIGTSPTVLFHGQEPLKPLDLRFHNSLEGAQPATVFVLALQDTMLQKIFRSGKENRLQCIIHAEHIIIRLKRSL